MAAAALSLLPRATRGDRTRTRLAEVALEEFRRVGVDRASVARIAERAGVSRPAFYFHFPTKEHVLLEIQKSFELPLVDRIARAPDLAAAVEAYVDGLIETSQLLGEHELFADMLRVYTRRPQERVYDEGRPFPTYEAMTMQFVMGAARGELKSGLEPNEAALVFLTSVFGVLISLPGEPDERRARLRTLASLFLREGDAS